MTPFDYPDNPHNRRHGPCGYRDYRSYRPWLRDEFTFRCVYCLKREKWGTARGTYDIDHFEPQAHRPDLGLHYENLLYSCAACNAAKGDQPVPDPLVFLLSGSLRVKDDGTIEGLSPEARQIIRVLGLDDAEYREFRMLLIGIVPLAEKLRPDLFRALMGFPDDLPDLSVLQPPENDRPQGVRESWLARKKRGELPDTY